MNTSGIGLGLFICKQIVDQFNGCIMVESEPRKGSQFMFYFEIEEDQQPGSEEFNLSSIWSQNES